MPAPEPRAARFALRESRGLFRGRFALGRRIGGRRLAVRYRVERGNAAHSAELAFRVRHLALRALGRSTIPKVADEARVLLHRGIGVAGEGERRGETPMRRKIARVQDDGLAKKTDRR